MEVGNDPCDPPELHLLDLFIEASTGSGWKGLGLEAPGLLCSSCSELQPLPMWMLFWGSPLPVGRVSRVGAEAGFPPVFSYPR